MLPPKVTVTPSTLLECSRQNPTGLLEISGVEAGLQTDGWLCNEVNGELAARAAAERDVDARGVRDLGAALESGPVTRRTTV